jgi:hypothetical protein
MPETTTWGDFYAPQIDAPVTCGNLDTTLNSLQDMAVAIDGNLGGTVREVYAETSGVNSDNKTRVGYVEISGTPVVDVVWAGEGGTTPSVTVSYTGGIIRVLDLFTTYENTNGGAAALDVVVNGVGAVEFDAVPLMNKIYHNAEFTAGAASANLYIDNDNTPQLRPYGYSSPGAGEGVIKIQIPNIPAAERYALRAIWVLS